MQVITITILLLINAASLQLDGTAISKYIGQIILTLAVIWGTVSNIVCHSQATPDLLAYLHHLIHFGHNRRLR